MVKSSPEKQETRVWSLDQKIPLRREWQLTPVFSPGEFHGQRSLVGYNSRGEKRVGHDWESNIQAPGNHCHVLWVYGFDSFRYLTWVESCNIFLTGTGLFHLAQHQGTFMLLNTSHFPPFCIRRRVFNYMYIQQTKTIMIYLTLVKKAIIKKKKEDRLLQKWASQVCQW